MKSKCQICGKKINYENSMAYGIYQIICPGCFDRQIHLKNRRTNNDRKQISAYQI